VKRRPTHFTVRALSIHLHKSRADTLALIKAAGIELTPTPLHYTDDRPRTRRNWRALTGQEVDRVLELVRAKQGAKLATRSP
jgi:hypothetical protein